jgi:hypothetical protein
MYSVNQITLTSILGGPLAGVYMLAKNYGIADLRVLEMNVQLIGYLLAALALIIAIYLPESAPGVVYAGLLVGGIRIFANAKQSELIETTLKEHASPISNWRCFAIGILFLIATMVVLFALIFALDPIGLLPEWYYENA